jgi:hypothetical protein
VLGHEGVGTVEHGHESPVLTAARRKKKQQKKKDG